MILTDDILKFSNPCMTDEQIAALSVKVGKRVNADSVDEIYKTLLDSGEREAAVFVRMAAARWAIKERGATQVTYYIFNTLTGMQEKFESQGQALARRESLKQEFLAANANLFLVRKEEFDQDGNSVLTALTDE